MSQPTLIEIASAAVLGGTPPALPVLRLAVARDRPPDLSGLSEDEKKAVLAGVLAGRLIRRYIRYGPSYQFFLPPRPVPGFNEVMPYILPPPKPRPLPYGPIV